ncbi:hypothetical protein C5167_038129 [Papaver somniferum]|uniref:Uncharacterized protein n=1 Tax=Papaver somniferum TaxID=3469 RepID=A0A4Y7I8M5_PAPSO|nr:hypothetical protein C5167_038129 [Papaver somniferum]
MLSILFKHSSSLRTIHRFLF